MTTKWFFCSILVILVNCIPLAHAASILDIGTDYRIRGISLSRADYGASDQNYSYYSQRALAHVGARFSPNIEFMTQFQALGVAGSSVSVTNPAINQAAANHYPNTNFTPWVQWAYMKAKQMYDSPVDLTVGRQPIMLGDGLILSDDDAGFTGIRLQSPTPFYDIRLDAFTFETGNTLVGNAATDLYGIELSKPVQQMRYTFTWLTEHDGSGSTVYVRPSENPATNARFLAGASTLASRITRSFYDARVEGRFLQGGYFKGEFALQNGHVNRDPRLGDVNLGGYGMLISAGLFTHISKYGPIEVHGLFALGSGDSGDSGTDNSFHPDFAHRVDGLERSGYGELFGATPFDAFASSTNPTGLPPGDSGIRIIGGGVTAHPTQLVTFGIDYFVYDAQQTATTAFPASSSTSSLGSEFDIGAGFAYTSYLTFRGSFAFFLPGGAFANKTQAKRYLIEAIGRF